MSKITSYISGVGHHLPDRIVTNKEMSKWMDTSDEWIRERTGIEERRFAEEGQGPSDLAIPAVTMALEDAQITKEQIDLIIFATISSDYYIPGSGCLLQDKMSFPKIGAFDIRAACSGFIYGLSMADQYIKAGTFKNILLVCSEVQSTMMDISDKGRNTSVIFGDGAGAVIISSTTKGKGILSTHLHTDGKYYNELWLKEPSSTSSSRLGESALSKGDQYLSMNGREVFRHAVTKFPEVINEALEFNNLTKDNIDLLIPHQANVRISQMVQKKLGLLEHQVYNNIQKYGNTTAASIPIALSEAKQKSLIKDNDIVVLAAFGSGFMWGSAAIKW